MSINLSVEMIISTGSLILAIVFWVLSTLQVRDAQKTLGDIKSEFMARQSELNKAAIDIISSRPEVIAKEVAREESLSLSRHLEELGGLIRSAMEMTAGEDKDKTLEALLSHHRGLILGKQNLMNQAMAMQMGQGESAS